jgi:hypothetical protein
MFKLILSLAFLNRISALGTGYVVDTFPIIGGSSPSGSMGQDEDVAATFSLSFNECIYSEFKDMPGEDCPDLVLIAKIASKRSAKGDFRLARVLYGDAACVAPIENRPLRSNSVELVSPVLKRLEAESYLRTSLLTSDLSGICTVGLFAYLTFRIAFDQNAFEIMQLIKIGIAFCAFVLIGSSILSKRYRFGIPVSVLGNHGVSSIDSALLSLDGSSKSKLERFRTWIAHPRMAVKSLRTSLCRT